MPQPIPALVTPDQSSETPGEVSGAHVETPTGHVDGDLFADPDTEETRLVARGVSAARFVLQFSTGESHTVWGSGILGRNPVPEPGEYFDHRIAIVDSGKSVSKTHLEFGHSAGAFWVQDRYSGNGTVIRRPNAKPQRTEPGKRYLLPRGSRIDIGDEFFVVS